MAFSIPLAWEVRTTGSDTNCGGAFRGGSDLVKPIAPTCTAVAGGSFAANTTFYVVVTYSDMWGETQASSETSVTTTTVNKAIQVTSPTSPQTFAYWDIYIGTASGGNYYHVDDQGTSPPYQFGSNQTVTSNPGSGSGGTSGSSSNEPPGTDYSQQDTAQVNVNNSTITATTPAANSNTITFTSGYTPTAADVGNMFVATGGTNINTGYYEILHWTSTTWVVTNGAQNLTTGAGAGSAITGFMGGGLASPGKAAGIKVSGNYVWLKSGTYSVTSTSTNVSNGCVNDGTSQSTGYANAWIGYHNTHADFDGTRPTIQNNQNTTTLFRQNPGGFGGLVWNIIFDNNSQSSTTAFQAPVGDDEVTIVGCKVMNVGTSGHGIDIQSGCLISNCEVTGGGGASGAGIVLRGNGVVTRTVVHDMAAACFAGIDVTGVANTVDHCLVFNETTPGSGTGIGINIAGATITHLTNCSVTGWRGSGIYVNVSSGRASGNYYNNVIYGNGVAAGTYDIDQAGSVGGGLWFNNFYGTANPFFNVKSFIATSGSNGGGTSGFNNTLLTANPFTSVSTGDLTLNNTSGGGLTVKNARSYPNPYAFVTNGTNYAVAGVLQPQSAGTTIIARRRKII